MPYKIKKSEPVPTVPDSPVMTAEELFSYLQWLEDSGMGYHLDDDVDSICWSAGAANEERIAYVEKMSTRMWESFTSKQIWDAAGEIWTWDSDSEEG